MLIICISGQLTNQWHAPVDFPIMLQQLLQAKLSAGHRLPVQTQRLMQLHGDRASVDVVQKALVHGYHVLGSVAVLGLASRHHRRGVQLEQIEGVGTEGGGFAVAQELQRRRGQSGADDLELQKVFSALRVERFVGRLGVLVVAGIRPEDKRFGAIGDFFELS